MTAIDVLRSHRPEVGDYQQEFDAALADLDALVQAAQKIDAGRLDEKGWTVAAWQEFGAAIDRVLGEAR